MWTLLFTILVAFSLHPVVGVVWLIFLLFLRLGKNVSGPDRW